MSTNSKTPKEIKDAFAGLFDNRTKDQQREDAAQLLSFRFLSEVERLMNERGMTKGQLAEQVGTSASYMTQLFRGDRLVNMNMLARFEQVFNIRFVAGESESAIPAAERNKPKGRLSSPVQSPIATHR